MNDPSFHVSVLGAGGLMGSAICHRLARLAHVESISAWNRTFARLDPDGSLRASGVVRLCSDLVDAIWGTNMDVVPEGGESSSVGDSRQTIRLVLTLLTDGDALMNILYTLQANDSLKDIILVQMSTISVDHSKEASALVHQGGGRYVDAPVFGSVPQIEEGKLQVFVSGVEEEYFRVNVWAVLQLVASDYFYVGSEIGQSTALKLSVNQLIPSLTSAFSVSFGMCERAGVDPDLLLRIIQQSSLRSPQFTKKYPSMKSRQFSRPNSTVQNMLKDIQLIATQAENMGVESATIRAMESLFEKACERGDGLLDYSAIFNTIHPALPEELPNNFIRVRIEKRGIIEDLSSTSRSCIGPPKSG